MRRTVIKKIEGPIVAVPLIHLDRLLRMVRGLPKTRTEALTVAAIAGIVAGAMDGATSKFTTEQRRVKE